MENNIKKRTFDKITFFFPLCLLGISKDKKKVLDSILIYSLDAYNKKNRLSAITLDFAKQNFSKRESNNYEVEIKNLAKDIKLKINPDFKPLESLINTWQFLIAHEKVYGKDAYCLIGKQLFQEVINDQFNYVMFTVYSAITSILGRKTATRITKKRLIQRINGYKSEADYVLSNDTVEFISDKKLNRILDLMCSKRLISKFTYRKRITIYSVKIKSKEALAKWYEKSRMHHLSNKSGLIDNQLSKNIKERLELRQETISEMKTELTEANYGNLFRIDTGKKRQTL